MTLDLRRLAVVAMLALVTLAFGMVLLRFTVQPGLASLADDSVSYLVMAQVWSPWHAASAAVQDIFPHEVFYPPLFPLLLAAFDAGSNFARAHAICAVLLSCSLPLAYLLGCRWLGNRTIALASTALFALLPGVWLNAKGVLSEPLFLIVLLAVLLELSTRKRAAVLALLFAGLVLTRAIGCAMVAGYLAWALALERGALAQRLRSAAPALIGLGVYAIWMIVRPTPTSDDYAAFGGDALGQLLHAPQTLGDRIAEQAAAFADAWSEALLVYWLQGLSAQRMLALVIGAVVILGWLQRLLQRQPDAAMLAAYAAVLLLWPFPGQMLRFLEPVLPLLLLYGFCAASALSHRIRGSALPAVALTICIAALCAPALLFLKARADAGASSGYASITEWYGSADLNVARMRAQTHLELFAMFDELHARTTPLDRIAWVAPGYVALLADRLAAPLPADTLGPEDYRRAVMQSGATCALLSTYHPRDTIHTAAWQAGLAALGAMPPVYVGRREDGNIYAALWRLRDSESR